MDTQGFSVVPHLLEQDGFPDAAQPNHQNALRGIAYAQALDGYPHRFAHGVPAGKFGRRSTCTRAERVLDWVHVRSIRMLEIL